MVNCIELNWLLCNAILKKIVNCKNHTNVPMLSGISGTFHYVDNDLKSTCTAWLLYMPWTKWFIVGDPVGFLDTSDKFPIYAESKFPLELLQDGMYVVRSSSRQGFRYCLSVYFSSKVYHIPIRMEAGVFTLGDTRHHNPVSEPSPLICMRIMCAIYTKRISLQIMYKLMR